MAMTSVPIRTNAELRPSRLFSSMFGYVKRSMLTIIRAFLMYKPLSFFMGLGTIPVIGGVALGIRFIVYAVGGSGAGHIQSLILASMLIIIGVLVWVLGLMGDIIASNRKLLEDIQYHVRKLDYDSEKRGKLRTKGSRRIQMDNRMTGIRQKTGYIWAFLIAFLPRLFWSLQAIPLRTVSDELSTMNGAVFFFFTELECRCIKSRILWFWNEYTGNTTDAVDQRSGHTLSYPVSLHRSIRECGSSHLFLSD